MQMFYLFLHNFLFVFFKSARAAQIKIERCTEQQISK